MSDRTNFAKLDPHVIRQHLKRLGRVYAETDGRARLLEDTKKTVLAQLTLQEMELRKCSKAEAETRALASEVYKDHLQASSEARTAAHIARVDYDTGYVWVDVARSLNANQRKAMETLDTIP